MATHTIYLKYNSTLQWSPDKSDGSWNDVTAESPSTEVSLNGGDEIDWISDDSTIDMIKIKPPHPSNVLGNINRNNSKNPNVNAKTGLANNLDDKYDIWIKSAGNPNWDVKVDPRVKTPPG